MPYPSPPESPGLARVAAQIEALRGELVPRLERIERQVERTNGRVTALELHDAHEAGADEVRRLTTGQSATRRWAVMVLALGALCSVVSTVTAALILIVLT